MEGREGTVWGLLSPVTKGTLHAQRGKGAFTRVFHPYCSSTFLLVVSTVGLHSFSSLSINLCHAHHLRSPSIPSPLRCLLQPYTTTLLHSKQTKWNSNWNKKSPRGIRPLHCSPSPQGAKYITVTQDTSPSGVVEVCDKYLFDRAKSRSLGLLTKKKTRKAPGAFYPAIVLPPLGL